MYIWLHKPTPPYISSHPAHAITSPHAHPLASSSAAPSAGWVTPPRQLGTAGVLVVVVVHGGLIERVGAGAASA